MVVRDLLVWRSSDIDETVDSKLLRGEARGKRLPHAASVAWSLIRLITETTTLSSENEKGRNSSFHCFPPFLFGARLVVHRLASGSLCGEISYSRSSWLCILERPFILPFVKYDRFLVKSKWRYYRENVERSVEVDTKEFDFEIGIEGEKKERLSSKFKILARRISGAETFFSIRIPILLDS